MIDVIILASFQTWRQAWDWSGGPENAQSNTAPTITCLVGLSASDAAHTLSAMRWSPSQNMSGECSQEFGFPDAGNGFWFSLNLLSCKSVNLFSIAKTSKLDDDDIYIMPNHKRRRDYLGQNKCIWHGPLYLPVQHTWLTAKIVLEPWASLSLSLSLLVFSILTRNLGVDKIIPNRRPE